MTEEFEQQWLSDLPSEWVEKRADFLCDPYRITVDPDDYEDDLVAHYSIPQVQDTGGPAIEPASDISSTKLLVNEPMLLVSKLNPRKQTICIAEPHEEYVTLASSEFVAISSSDIDQRYAFFLWSSQKVTDRLSAIVQSATRSHQRVNPSDITKLPWKWPPLDVQRRIAAFLDEKTARIDALIAKKRALLERLAEKRQALITRAVTQGLDPDAPRKPSGIDWLGEIPAHWEVKPLRRVRRYLTSGSRGWAAYYADEGDPFLRMTNVTGHDIELDLSDLRYVDLDDDVEGIRTSVLEGDVLITITAELGAVAIVRKEHEGAYINQHLALFRPDSSVCVPDFLVSFLSTDMARAQFMVSGQGGTKQGLGFEQVNNVVVGFPPLEEQARIGDYCRDLWKRFEAVHEPVTRSIERMIEYRSALVTAAVTGQIEGLR